MDSIADLILRYRRELDFYNEAVRLVAQEIDSGLRAQGVRAIVSSRAKDPDRTEAKCRQRNPSKYRKVEDIYDDIVDLSGVRVALYFPGDQSRVRGVITEAFEVLDTKTFPRDGGPRGEKSFSGYSAEHYRVQLKESRLSGDALRYTAARIEIQVASVLMHAWAEVEHDLQYKPGDITLSPEELMILDELNGLVLAGGISS